MRSLKILLIAAPVGAGHQKAAEAVGAAFKALEPSCTVQFLDIFSFFPRCLVSFFLKAYMKSLFVFPQLYARAYAWGNQSGAALRGNGILSRFLAARLRCYMQDVFQPDAVICTHATAAAAVNVLLREGSLRFYHGGIITDFVIHRLWIHSTVCDYFIADHGVCSEVLAASVAPECIHAFGIPVGQRFREIGVAAKPHVTFEYRTLLLMGGGGGLLPMAAILEALEAAETKLHVIALTGCDEKLRQCLLYMASASHHKVTVLGFTDCVADYMAAADLMISKAGGLSASEALCAGLPVLFYHPLPGQEQANVDFLIRMGTARKIEHLHALSTEIDKIFGIESDALQRMKAQAQRMAKPDANVRIAKYILNKLCN